MLPGAHQGKSESELFNSLKAHLNNKNRLQPFIGLSSIIECVNGGAPQRDVFFICEVCVCRLDKADMRNHIMGSLHRYNVIKTRHPELVSELGEDSCLSKLAWPLMDIAKRIEKKEGPGNVQVVEFDKTSYQQMESHNNADDVIDFLRNTLKETEPEISETISFKTEESVKSPPQRTVLLSPRWKSEEASLDLQNSPRQSNETHRTKHLVDSSSFLNDYGGQAPLLGLMRVIECKSQDDQTHCFLCHCCRVRAHKYDIISHLTSTSHITNFLMETHPELLDTLDLTDGSQVELLAENLGKEAGEGTKLMVVHIPEALCIQMTGKSYHWCVKTVGWNNSDFPVTYIDVKRRRLTKFSHQKVSLEAENQFKQGKKKKQKRDNKRNNPVFKVTLPITRGSLLVKRTSFSKDHLPLPADCLGPRPSSDLHISSEPLDFTLNSSSEVFDCISENPDLSSHYQQKASADFPKRENDHMDEVRTDRFEDQNVNNTNIDIKVACVQEMHAPVPHYSQTSSPSHNEYLPHSFPWSIGLKENEGCAPPYYQQPPQYMAPEVVPGQNMFCGQIYGGYSGSPQNPQTGVSFSHNNTVTIQNCSQAYSRYYAEHGENAHQYASYQLSTSGWGTYQPQLSAQTLCNGPCGVPSYPGAAFSNATVKMESSNAMYYPMSNVYSSYKSPY